MKPLLPMLLLALLLPILPSAFAAENAYTKLYQKRVDVARAKLEILKVAVTFEDKRFSRNVRLSQSGAASIEEYDASLARRDGARAAVILAQAKLEEAEVVLQLVKSNMENDKEVPIFTTAD